MKGKRAKASVSSFEFNEPKEARAPIKLVQKRDFLLPRRKESEPDGTGMVHEEQPFNPSKETKWTKRPRQARRHKQEPCCGCLERGGFLLLLLPCQMQDLRFFFFPPMESIRLDSLPLSHNNDPKKTKPLTRECETHGWKWMAYARRRRCGGRRRTGRGGGQHAGVPEWWRAAPC